MLCHQLAGTNTLHTSYQQCSLKWHNTTKAQDWTKWVTISKQTKIHKIASGITVPGPEKTDEKWTNATVIKFKYQKHLKCDSPLETSWLSASCLMVVHSPVQPPNLPDRLWPLLTILFGLLPLNQLKVRLRDDPRFFLLLLILFCKANISVMSLGTRSPVELLLDILNCHLLQSRHLL